jgi:hypothetical protein
MIDLPLRFISELRVKPETGMGYQIVSVVLVDGRRFDKVVVIEGRISPVKVISTIPFSTEDIRDFILTHKK